MLNCQDPAWIASGLVFWRDMVARATSARARAHCEAQLQQFERWNAALDVTQALHEEGRAA